jgi:hypothetical protein
MRLAAVCLGVAIKENLDSRLTGVFAAGWSGEAKVRQNGRKRAKNKVGSAVTEVFGSAEMGERELVR